MPCRRPQPHQRLQMAPRAAAAPPKPTTSWWIGAAREDFYAAVHARQDALQNSDTAAKMRTPWHGEKR